MARLYSFSLTVFLCTIMVAVNGLPTVRKPHAADRNAAKPEASNPLEVELDKLKEDGVSVQKSERTLTENVNGKTQVVKSEKETVTDAKTGELVASVSKTVTKGKDGQKKEEARVDVPAAGIHQDVTGPEAENVELIPADDVARYIFDTSDIDGVKTAVQSMVDTKKISKKAADDYVHEIRERLNLMHDQALKEMTAEMEERRREEDGVYKDMMSITGVLNENADTEQALYLYAKKLYTAYRTEGDDYAKEILTQFTNDLQQETDAGSLNESVQDNVYDIILKALKDVNEELEANNANGSQDVAEAPESPKSKLPKD